MKRFIHKINQIMTQLSGISLGFIMIFILVDIIGRTISRSVFGASELAIFTMIITVYLGLSYCEERNGHVRVEILLSYVSPKYKKILNFVSYSLVFVMLGIVVYSVGKYALFAYKNNEAISGPKPLVIYPVIFIMVISCIFYWIQVGLNLLEKFNELFKKDRKLN